MVDAGPVSVLAGRLGLGAHEHVAIVGGGGKSSLLFALGRELPGRVVMTTTTRIFAAQTQQNFDRLFTKAAQYKAAA